jgi:DNA-binding transcriptional LysR family regulator
MIALRNAAVAGVGVCQLPVMMVRDQLTDGSLVRLLPDWAPRREILHAVFPSRRGLLPGVRMLIDYLAERFEKMEED